MAPSVNHERDLPEKERHIIGQRLSSVNQNAGRSESRSNQKDEWEEHQTKLARKICNKTCNLWKCCRIQKKHEPCRLTPITNMHQAVQLLGHLGVKMVCMGMIFKAGLAMGINFIQNSEHPRCLPDKLTACLSYVK